MRRPFISKCWRPRSPGPNFRMADNPLVGWLDISHEGRRGHFRDAHLVHWQTLVNTTERHLSLSISGCADKGEWTIYTNSLQTL
jgi:hypothetical protein